ncbi:hypothetical protein DSL72_009006 [Monilinia vaccinii-corymbosi]|uniref:Heterokaryon incompatibility domain-containing protein n=1 Tax=Monilinia vaccinii-corymbosi TaxID=61207 RepID=A0A8A3PQ29_9HELO|nr:hypothetical protein DSL72_009006 [Monilinia vaccinii-corymbosi]
MDQNEVHESKPLGEVLSHPSTALQPTRTSSSLSSDTSFSHIDNLQSRRHKFDKFVEAVNNLPQPHHKVGIDCSLCDDVRLETERGRSTDKRVALLWDKCRLEAYLDKGMNRESYKYKGPLRGRQSIEAVLQAAHEGCCLCTLVVQAIAALGEDELENLPLVNLETMKVGDAERYTIGRGEYYSSLVIELYAPAGEPTVPADYGLLYITDDPSPLPFIAPAHEISNSVSESFHRAKGWIANCRETHQKCNVGYIEEPKLPTRIIDFGNSNDSVKLIETEDKAALFAALRYCWGDPAILESTKLTQAKLLDYKENIPMESPPKTLFDAVVITRGLGIPYLWIDSLCIIQDSSIDWQVESSHMSEVYTLAFLVIAATDAKDSNVGCLFENRAKSVRLPYLDEFNRQHALCTLEPNSNLSQRCERAT